MNAMEVLHYPAVLGTIYIASTGVYLILTYNRKQRRRERFVRNLRTVLGSEPEA